MKYGQTSFNKRYTPQNLRIKYSIRNLYAMFYFEKKAFRYLTKRGFYAFLYSINSKGAVDAAPGGATCPQCLFF